MNTVFSRSFFYSLNELIISQLESFFFSLSKYFLHHFGNTHIKHDNI